MALRPGSCLLMSSHFIASPLSRMIFSSSSGDHLDCFLAGDSDGCVPCCLFIGTLAATNSGVESAVVDAIVVGGTDADRDDGGAETVARASSSSSSFGFRSSEISTLARCERRQAGGLWGPCRLQSMCAASQCISTCYTKEYPTADGRRATKLRRALRSDEESVADLGKYRGDNAT
jgi:hypothetical protein